MSTCCTKYLDLARKYMDNAEARTDRSPWGHLEYSMEQCEREGIRKHYLFKKQKGPDMLLLESGCQVPVMDRWMMRRMLTPTPEQEYSFGKEVLRIQRNEDEYKLVRDAVIEEASECQVPVGEHHVSCWLETLFGDDRAAAEGYLNELIEAVKEPGAA